MAQCGITAPVPDVATSNASYSNVGASCASKARNRGLAHI